MPNARLRSPGAVNRTASSDSAVGASSAAHAPCTLRATISMGRLTAAPLSAEAAAKPTNPIRNARRLPTRGESAIRPPSSNRPPKASVYAVMTHCRSASEKVRAACADGIAMFTTVASSAIISCAAATNTSASHRRSSGGCSTRRCEEAECSSVEAMRLTFPRGTRRPVRRCPSARRRRGNTKDRAAHVAAGACRTSRRRSR